MVKQNRFAITKANSFNPVTIEIKCQGIPQDCSIGGFFSCAVPECVDELAEAYATSKTTENTS